MKELHVDKTASHKRAEVEFARLSRQQPGQVPEAWENEYRNAFAHLLEYRRAHNVARLNKCTGFLLRPFKLSFRFVTVKGASRPQMSLCREIKRKFFPFEYGPTVPADRLHEDELVSAAIASALDIARDRAKR